MALDFDDIMRTDFVSSSPTMTESMILMTTIYVIKDIKGGCQSLKTTPAAAKNKNIADKDNLPNGKAGSPIDDNAQNFSAV